MRKLMMAILMGLVFVTGNAYAVKGNDNPGNPSNNGQGGPPTSEQGGGNNGNGGKPSVGDVTVTNVLGQKVTTVTTSASRSASVSASKSLSASNSNSNATGGAASSTANAGGNSQVVNVGGDSGRRNYSGSYTVRSVGVAPDIVANPTAPCRVAIGASGGWIGGALGISGSVLDEGCDARADATMLVMMGYEGAAAARLCQKPEMAKALGTVVCPTEEKAVTNNTQYNAGFKH